MHLANIQKSYGATRALIDATLRLSAGRVHALLGENGAGKSTIVKIIVGLVTPDAGTMQVFDQQVQFREVGDAIRAGIVPIYQHLSLFPDLSVIENLSAFAFGGLGGFNLRRRHLIATDTARQWLERVGLNVRLDALVSTLSVGERQLLEIARGLGQNCRILILDEPTAALTDDEASRLFDVIRKLSALGVATLFISHKFHEIDSICDDVTVLRDGRTIICGAALKEMSRLEIIHAMVGSDVAESSAVSHQPGEPIVTMANLRMRADAPAFDIEIGRGEIVGIAGLVGSGAIEIAEAFAGASARAAGELTVDGIKLALDGRAQAVAAGIGFIPSDRQSQGLFASADAVANTSASSLKRLTTGGFLRRGAERGESAVMLKQLGLHPFQLDKRAAEFSGGNQQKLLIARNLLLAGQKLLVALEPTRGVDVGARHIIHEAIMAAARQELAVIVGSTDLDEVIGLAHRVVAVRDHQVVQVFEGTISKPMLLEALTGRIQ